MKVPAWVVASAVVAVVAGSVWLVSTRTRPSFAVYDSLSALPLAQPPAPPRDSSLTPARDGPVLERAPGTHHPPPHRSALDTAATAVAPDSDTTVTRPHRSDNYGGYSGYGSRERRRPPNGK